MRKPRNFVLAAVLTMLVVSAASAQKVNVDWDKNTDFSKFKTYTWTQGTPAKNPLVDQRIVEAVDTQLAAKGLRKVEPTDNPEMIVLYHGATSEETQLNTTSMGYGWGWTWGGTGTQTTTVSKIPVGHLAVDLVDASTKKLVWLGHASDTISDKPEKNEQKIKKAVDKMFKKYPPPEKK